MGLLDHSIRLLGFCLSQACMKYDVCYCGDNEFSDKMKCVCFTLSPRFSGYAWDHVCALVPSMFQLIYKQVVESSGRGS